MTKQPMIQNEKFQRFVKAANRANAKSKGFGCYERPYEMSLVVLFWKYISDIWREDVERAKNLDSVAKRNLKLAQSRFVLPEKTSFYDVVSRLRYPGLTTLVRKTFKSLSETNSRRLAGTFEQIVSSRKEYFTPHSAYSDDLNGLLSEFNVAALDMRPSQSSDFDLGETFLHLISRYYSSLGKIPNRYYTHDDIATLMAKLATPNKGDTICDPFCGTGSMLVRISQEVGKDQCRLFGQEKDSAVQAIARMNLMINEIEDSLIADNDSLATSFFSQDILMRQYDRVIADPPTSKLDIGSVANINVASPPKDYEQQWKQLQRSSTGHLLCVDTLFKLTKPKEGKLVVVIPTKMLSLGEPERLWRKDLLSSNLVDAVISIPAQKMFNRQPAKILVIDRSRERDCKNANKFGVMFIDGNKSFENLDTSIDGEYKHVNQIVSTYLNQETRAKYSSLVPNEKIARNDFDLTVSKYI